MARLVRGEPVDPALIYFRCSPSFETVSASLRWINERMFVGTGARHPDKVVRRWLKVDKLSTALGTDDGKPRAYRFGYGVLDENLNFVADPAEKKVYFEVSDFSTYVFFENPR